MSLQLVTIMTAGAGMALVGLVYNSYTAYFMVAALVALLLVSYAVSRLSTRSLDWRRHAHDRVFENESFPVTVELTNRGRLPRFLMTVVDTLPPFVQSDGPQEAVLPALWPRQQVKFSYQVRALKRGVYPIGPLRVSVSDPFGMFPRFVPFEARDEAIVYPRRVPLGGEAARSGLEFRGITAGERARAAESGMEFYGVRDYRSGDELRRIHWPATARHGRLTVIEFDRGASGDLVVVLDAKAGTEFGRGVETTLEVGVRAAASLMHWALENEGVGLLTADSESGPRWLEVDRLDREYEALEMLARVQANGSMRISEMLAWVAPRLPLGAKVFVLTAAPDEDLPGVVQSLRWGQVRLYVVVVDPHDFDLRVERPEAMLEALQAAGAVTVDLRRDDDLAEAIGSVLVGSD